MLARELLGRAAHLCVRCARVIIFQRVVGGWPRFGLGQSAACSTAVPRIRKYKGIQIALIHRVRKWKKTGTAAIVRELYKLCGMVGALVVHPPRGSWQAKAISGRNDSVVL
jgi:hypothetical protein